MMAAAVVEVIVAASLDDVHSATQLKEETCVEETDSGHWSGDVAAAECVLEKAQSGVSLDETYDASGESEAQEEELRIDMGEILSPAPLVDSLENRPRSTVVVTQQGDSASCIVCLESLQTTDEFNWSTWEYDSVNNYINLPCCERSVCKECMEQLVVMNVNEGHVHISCPHPKCGKALSKSTVLTHLEKHADIKAKYTRFCLDQEGDGTKKTCPNCCLITEHHLPKLRRLTEKELKVQCMACEFEWCFRCQAPWHVGLSCKQFMKGNTHFRKWTHGRSDNGVANCQKCPTCRVYIQRSTGCPHMTCSQCDTEFCYDCGGRFLEVDPIIDHKSDELEIWGCPDIYLPNEPVKRKLVRGGWLGARLTFLAGYPVVLIGAAVLVVAGAAVVLPIYGGYKLYRYHKHKYRS